MHGPEGGKIIDVAGASGQEPEVFPTPDRLTHAKSTHADPTSARRSPITHGAMGRKKIRQRWSCKSFSSLGLLVGDDVGAPARHLCAGCIRTSVRPPLSRPSLWA